MIVNLYHYIFNVTPPERDVKVDCSFIILYEKNEGIKVRIGLNFKPLKPNNGKLFLSTKFADIPEIFLYL